MKGNSEVLLSYIRDGRTMSQSEKLWLIVSLSIPSILAQISATVMFFIDASMVGHLGAKASAAIGLVESTGWLMGGLASAANMGFSVQVAHFIGRQSLVCCMIWALMISLTSVIISPFLPYWLGGTEEIAHDASVYFAIFGLSGIFFQMEGLAGSMLKCSGNMKIPSILNIGMCVMDVCFNYLFIYIMDLGVMGAAIGTGLAMLITAVLMLYFLLVKSKMLSLIRCIYRQYPHCGSTGHHRHRRPLAGHHRRESLLHAWLRHRRGCHHPRGTGHWCRTEVADALICKDVCRPGHRRHDLHGYPHVVLRPRADGHHVACRGSHRPRNSGAAHRGLGRADVCCCHRLQRCLYRSWRHDDSCRHESLFDVVRPSDTCCRSCS